MYQVVNEYVDEIVINMILLKLNEGIELYVCA